MIQICYTRNGSTFGLQASGHAGSAPVGEDLVCCAVSTLVHTLAQRVLDLEAEELAIDASVILEPAGSCIRAKTAAGSVMLMSAFETIVTGLQMLAEQWPQFVVLNCYEIIPETG